MFERELDRYQAALRGQHLSVEAVREAREEMATHLEVDYAARLERGASEPEARAGALAALGDLRVAARAERLPHWRLGRILLFVAPALASLAWYLPQWIVIRHGVLPAWFPSALELAFFVATPLGTVLVRRVVLGPILVGAVIHGLLIGGGMLFARGDARWPIFEFILGASAAMAAFGLVATVALHLVTHLLVFGLSSRRSRPEGASHA